MDSPDAITLPAEPPSPRRAPIPLLAACVPVAAGVVLWAVTGSLMALCFAGLGPLMMLASVLDGGRGRRRERRQARADAEEQWAQAQAALDARQRTARERLWLALPGVEACLREQPLRRGRIDADTQVVLGSGEVATPHRVSGGEGERAEEFRRRAAVLSEAPVAVALGAGICIRMPLVVGVAVARAVAVQLGLRFSPGQLALVGPGLDETGLAGMPHARRIVAGALRLGVVVGAGDVRGVDAVLRVLDGDEAVAGASVIVDGTDPCQARVRTAEGSTRVRLDGLSRAQIADIGAAWEGDDDGGMPVPLSLSLGELSMPDPEPGLAAPIGRGECGDAVLDLVADGPHAIVTGMTGSGKSELLVTWVTALARVYGPDRVCFVLADFKGGTAFDPLGSLPQVTAVITDLDDGGARRGVESLRAELRRREAVLATAGARDIADPAVAMPRLVIVVDEFAALLHEHPELADVFTDIAARGRALGMHLILGTQRAAGVVRDALAANCPLRLSLRVAEAADSRAVVGSDAAADLPGDATGRGLALIRRPRDAQAHLVRVALTPAADIEAAGAAWNGCEPAVRPWLPPLPVRLELAELAEPRGSDAGAKPGELVLGLADEPERQRQERVVLRVGEDRGLMVLGGPGSGTSGILALLAAQTDAVCVVSADPEEAWDAVASLAERPRSGLVLCDDLEAVLAQYPADYAQEFAQRWERIVRGAGEAGATVVLTASRLTAAVARLAELLPRRAILAYPSRAEHMAAGGDAQGYTPGMPSGRGRLEGRLVQFALAPAPLQAVASRTPVWAPERTTAIVAPFASRLAQTLRARYPGLEVHSVAEASETGSPGDTPAIVVGDGESWQRAWGLWQRLREEADLLVLAESQTELRTLVGMRELPPYARTHQGRAWLLRPGAPARRVRGLELSEGVP